MALYIPFIHKKPKKEKINQLPLYIEKPIPLEKPEKEVKEESKGPIIIELF